MNKQRRILAFAPALTTLQTDTEHTSYRFGVGGSGSLTAVSLSRSGLDCLHCAQTGADDAGEILRRIYAKNEVSTRFLHADKEDHTTLQVVRRGAEKTQRDEFPMQHTHLSRAQVESAFTCLPDAVYCEDTQKPEVLKHIFALAEKHNCPVLFRATTGRAAQFFKDGENTGKQIRVLLADEREAATLTGSNTYSISNLAIKLSICISASYYVINFGRRGIYLYDGMHTRELYPSEMREGGEAVTCMAAFSGAFAAEYLRTQNAAQACLFANFAQALAARHADGGVEALPYLSQVRAHILKLASHRA